MRKAFLGYYQPDEEEFSKMWEDCLFVLDANVLLNLYRYSPETSEVLIDILRKISERLWIPHQVALEYQDNRLTTIAGQVKLYDDISKTLRRARQDLEDSLSGEHPSIDGETLLEKINEAFSAIEEELERHRAQHPDLFADDDIRDKVTSLFEGKVGQPFSQERLAEIYKMGEERYANQVPPGYKDKEKRGELKRYGNLILKSMYGDLILWFQIIDKAKEAKTPIIFVTDDTKEDWWWIFQGKTIGPRPELVTEMEIEASVPFYMYTPKRFMLYAAGYVGIEIAEEVAEEVQDVTEGRSWKDEIVSTLDALGGEAHLSEIYEHIESTTLRKLARTWKATIRYTLQIHSSDTESFRGGEDLFRRIGRGYWGLRSNDAGNGGNLEGQKPAAA